MKNKEEYKITLASYIDNISPDVCRAFKFEIIINGKILSTETIIHSSFIESEFDFFTRRMVSELKKKLIERGYE
mgnify:FL=1